MNEQPDRDVPGTRLDTASKAAAQSAGAAGTPDSATPDSATPASPGPSPDGRPDQSGEGRPLLEYPCGDPPAPGRAREVAPGVMWARLQLPFTLDHINVWAVRDGKGWAVFDTGVRNSENAAAWRELFTDGGDLGPEGVTRVFVTHMHPDHVGMAGWLIGKFECRLWMTQLEYLNCRVLVGDTGREAPPGGVSFYRQAGWDDEALEHYRARFGNFGKLVYALPDSYRRIRDGEWLRIGDNDWQVVVGTGHSPEHACFYCPALRVMISGDQVLPKISSNVSVFPTEPDADPLHGWLTSIDRLQRVIPDDVLVLPAHNEPFRGLDARLSYLAKGHAKALDKLRESLDQPRRVIDLFGALFARPIDDQQLLSLATGETLSHLNYLWHRGEIVTQRDAQGLIWYQNASAAV